MLELKTKGELPRFDRVTDTALLRIGERAMDRYLARVTGKVAKRTRSGSEGERKLREYEVEQTTEATKGIVTLTPSLGLQEYGGVIRARNVKYMTIPLKAARNADGTPKRLKARQWRDTRVIKSKHGKLLIVMRQGRRWIPLYALKRQVRIPARLGLCKELSRERVGFWREIGKEISSLLTA